MNRRDAIKAGIGAVAALPLTTCLDGQEIGELITPQTHGLCRVFDAYGREWKGLRWVHTGSGECEQIVKDIMGRPQIDWKRKEVVTNRHRIPTPITIIPINSEDKA